MHQPIDYDYFDPIDAQTALTWFRRDRETFVTATDAHRVLQRRYRKWCRNSQGRGGFASWIPVAMLRAAGALLPPQPKPKTKAPTKRKRTK